MVMVSGRGDDLYSPLTITITIHHYHSPLPLTNKKGPRDKETQNRRPVSFERLLASLDPMRMYFKKSKMRHVNVAVIDAVASGKLGS
jgi:hypothetical protein